MTKITHTFVSTKADGADATELQPSNWGSTSTVGDTHVGDALPPQWSDGGHGDVTATVDDVATTAITIKELTGQTESLFEVQDDSAIEVLALEHRPAGQYRLYMERGIAKQILQIDDDGAGGTDVYWTLTQGATDYQVFDVFIDSNDDTNSYSVARFLGKSTQDSAAGGGPILSVSNENGLLFSVAGDGSLRSNGAVEVDGDINAFGTNVKLSVANIGFFGQTPAAQPTTPTTINEVIAALQALGLTA